MNTEVSMKYPLSHDRIVVFEIILHGKSPMLYRPTLHGNRNALSFARRALKNKFPTPMVPLTTVLTNRQVFLPDPVHKSPDWNLKKPVLYPTPGQVLTNVISRDAAAALMWRLGCLTELEQSKARANVPTDLDITRNWSICLSVRWCDGVQTKVSKSSRFRLSVSSEIQNTYVNTEGETRHDTIKHIYCTCKTYLVWRDVHTTKTDYGQQKSNLPQIRECKYHHWQKQSFMNWPTLRFLTLRRLMSYIYGAPILDVSRSHTTTQHSR